jgi:ubiquinone/menaquinone biosynthesis C-methylase UbiE
MSTELKTTNTQRPRNPGWYKRLFAYMMSQEGTQHDALLSERKRALLGRLHGNVLEIGAGTAPNLTYYAADVHWLGIEPNPAMFRYAQQTAQQLGKTIELREGNAEHLPALSGTMDAVVSTHVLCSVRDPGQVMGEILRVLKPGGQFIFLEHVAAPEKTSLRRLQKIIRPVWGLFSDGCHPDRETWTTIQQAGFSQVQIDHFRLDTPFIGPHISGYAVK